MNIKILIIIVFISARAHGQLIPLALNGLKVNSLALIDIGYPEELKKVMAGTDSGIYYHPLSEPDSVWPFHFFNGSLISSVYVQVYGRGPVDMSRIFISLHPDTLFGRTLVYTYDSPILSYWTPLDSGLNKNDTNMIISFAGFNYSSNESPKPVFCLDSDHIIYRLENDKWVRLQNDYFFNIVNVLHSNGSALWGGGAGGDFVSTLYFCRSYDYGETWEKYYFDAGKVCYSLSSLPEDTTIMYAGLNGAVAKTTDAGISWNLSSLDGNAIITSIVINPLNHNEIFAGGKISNSIFILYKSSDSGVTWEEIIPQLDWRCKGRCIIDGINTMTGAVVEGEFILYIGTDGSGVFKYTDNIAFVENLHPNKIDKFLLYQNYPNPFNPVTRIKYNVKDNLLTTLKIYDILGKLVAVLVNEVKEPGEYEAIFDASALTSGVYFYELKTGDLMQTKRMVLLR